MTKFWRKVAEEVEPVLRHMIVVAILQILFVSMLMFMRLLQVIAPGARDVCRVIEIVDMCFIAALTSMFAVYAVASVAKLLWGDITN